MDKNITILGAGIAGLSTAIHLQKNGFKPTIFERFPQVTPIGAGITLATNAMLAFKRIGIMEEIMAKGKLVSHIEVLDHHGKVLTDTNLTRLSKYYGAGNYAIHRADLHEILLSKIDRNHLFLNKESVDIERLNDDTIRVKFSDGTQHTTGQLIVAEGIHSPIRKKLLPHSKIRFAGYTCWRGILKNPNLPINGSSETWGKGRRFGIVPTSDDSLYWFACINAKKNDIVFRNYTLNDLKSEFGPYHSSISTILEHTDPADLIWSDIIDLKPIPKYAFGNVVLIGDAAHATTPNMGQGACQAAEDAVVLVDELKKYHLPSLAFQAFEKRRIKRTQDIVNKSWTIGKIAQLSGSLSVAIRNTIFGNLPTAIKNKQIEALYNVDF